MNAWAVRYLRFDALRDASLWKAGWPTVAMALILLFSAGLLTLAVKSEKVPLLSEDGWSNPDSFLRAYPDRLNSHISQGIIDMHAALFINVGPEWKSKTGRLESRPFTPSSYMVIPLRGLVYSVGGHGAMTFNPTGGSVTLVCLGNGKTIDLLNSPSQDWFERAVSIPKFWCATQAKLVAEVVDPDIFLGIGTPFKVNWAYAAVAGAFSWLVAYGVASIVFLALFVPPLFVTGLSYLARTSVSLLVLGGFGYVSYVVQALNAPPATIAALTIIMILIPSIGSAIAIALLGKSETLGEKRAHALARRLLLSRMSLVWMIVGVAYVVPLAAIPTHSGSWTVNYAFYPVSWSTDNQLPLAMARYVMETDLVQPPGLGAWSVTDRGFVPAGLIAGELVMLDLLGLEKESPISYLLAQTIVALANACVLLLLLHLPSVSRFSFWRVSAIATIICTTPFFFFNVLYSWPKMAAGTAALWSIMTLMAALRLRQYSLLWLPAPLYAMAMLFHSAVLFLLPVIILYAGWHYALLFRNRVVRISYSQAAMAALSVAISLTLVAYHNSFGAQSSYGITFVLTGSGVFGLSKDEVVKMLTQYYSELTLRSYLVVKWEQVTTLVWPALGFAGVFDYEKSLLARLRIAGFFSALPALSIFPIGVLLIKKFQLEKPRYDVLCLRDGAIITAATVLALLVGSAFPFLVHHLPYAFLLSIILSATLMANYDVYAVRVLVAIHVVAFLIVWPIGSWWIWSTHFASGAP